MIAKLYHNKQLVGEVLTGSSLSTDELLKLCNIDPNEQVNGEFLYDYDLFTTEYVQDDGEKAQASEPEEKILKQKLIDDKYMLYIKKGNYGNQLFFEDHEVPGLNTSDMIDFCDQTGLTQDELIAFADGFDIWD